MMDLEKAIDHQAISSQHVNNDLNSSQYINKGGWKASCLILSMEACERLATLGIALNLVTYLHDQMHETIPSSANVVTNYLGASCLTCLLGGFIADTYLGRYRTIIVGSCIQFIGLSLMVLSASLKSLRPPACELTINGSICEPASSRQLMVLYGGLYMIALGTGGIKSNVSGLGADQFEDGCEKGRQKMQSYFNWFGVTLSVASIMAVTILVYVQDNQGRGVGYGISLACMGISLALFIGGSTIYSTRPPRGSPLTQVAQVLVASWRNRHFVIPYETSHFYNHNWESQVRDSPSHRSSSTNEHNIEFSGEPRLLHTNQFLCLDKAALIHEPTNKTFNMIQSPWTHSSTTKIEEVKMFLRLLPILASTTMFWTTYAQMVTFSVEQGVTLNRKIGRNFEIPPASLTVFMQVSVLVTLPLYDRVLIPFVRSWRRNEYGITSLQRIGVGLILSTLSMVVASTVERKRLKVAHDIQNLGYTTLTLPMSVFYLVPQYVLTGVANALIYIGQLELFYRESPYGMRSFTTGLCLGSFSIGFFFSSALVSSVNGQTKRDGNLGWLANDLNDGHLDYFYLLLGGFSFCSFLLFLIFAKWYIYNHPWKNSRTFDSDSTCATPTPQVQSSDKN